jgi:choline dehydrogenase
VEQVTNDNTNDGPQVLAGSSLKQVYDYIIVGAGSAGCAMARRLIDQTNARVLLLESASDGVNIPSITDPSRWLENVGSNVDYQFLLREGINTNNNLLPLPRGKVLGGSGSINGMVWARGDQDDYNGWSAAGNPGWDFKSVLPLFKKIEDWEEGETDFHGSGGPLRIERAKELHIVDESLLEAGKSFGMPFLEDTNGPSPEGIGILTMNIRDGLRCSPFVGYLAPVLDNKKLTLLTNAKVLKLVIKGDQCVGVEYVRFGKKFTVKSENEVILAAGVIESPRILMLSGIGDQGDLQKLGIKAKADLAGVGKNLHDHVLLQGLIFEAKNPLGPFKNNLSGAVSYWKSNSGLLRPDLMILSGQVPFQSPEISKQYIIPPNSFSLLPALVQVKSRGQLKMTTDRYDGPLDIDPDFFREEADFEALVNAVEICLELADEPDLRSLIKGPVVNVKNRQEIIRFVRDACSTYSHPVGTCSMGTHELAVVTPDLLVRGIRGLRVADASVMPAVPASNTNAPTLMVAEFASQLIITQK